MVFCNDVTDCFALGLVGCIFAGPFQFVRGNENVGIDVNDFHDGNFTFGNNFNSMDDGELTDFRFGTASGGPDGGEPASGGEPGGGCGRHGVCDGEWRAR